MTICPLCLVLYFGISACPECSERTHWICHCGDEWQSPEDWARSNIRVEVKGRLIDHRLTVRCGPALMMQQATA